jgi:hypothetical protein
MKASNRFYVYVYLDPRKPGKYVYEEYEFDYEPFYIGKGCDRRKDRHISEAKRGKNSFNLNKIRKIISENLYPIIIVYNENMFENDAIALEIKMISSIGRFDLKLGPLTNLTIGGDGAVGHIKSKETRDKLSKAHTGKKFSEEHKSNISLNHYDVSGENNPMFGRNHSITVVENSRKRATGKKASIGAKKKMSLNSTGIGNPNVKLTEKDVLKIRDLYVNKGKTISELSRKYNVNPPCIDKIVKRRSWKHLP